MPTSVLLAVLAAAGLLALAPALTRRYDVPERVAEERATSTARVLSRRRRRRTVPGSRPINPPRYRRLAAGTASRAGRGAGSRKRRASGRGAVSARSSVGSTPETGVARSAGKGSVGARTVGTRNTRRRPTPRRRPQPTAVHRRRRVLVALVLLNLVELAGVFLVGTGFWIGFSVSFTVLLADLVYLRRRAVVTARRRRTLRRRQAWISVQQAAVRREHERRAAQRKAAARVAVSSRWEAAAPLRDEAGGAWDLVRGGQGLPVNVVDGSGAVAQPGSAPRSHRGGQGFESPQLHPRQRPSRASGMALFRSTADWYATAPKCWPARRHVLSPVTNHIGGSITMNRQGRVAALAAAALVVCLGRRRL